MTGTIETGKICSWDAEPHPTYNLWTIGNASEVVPGISRPFYSTLGADLVYDTGQRLAELVGIADLIDNRPAPVGGWAAVIGGRWALNLAMFNAMINTWQLGEGSDLMAQFITSTDGHDIRAGAAADRARAEQVAAHMLELQRDLPRQVTEARQRVDTLRVTERERTFAGMSTPELWDHMAALVDVCAEQLARHLAVSASAGDFGDQLGKLLVTALPDGDPALGLVLTSALRDVESAKPAKASWDVAKFVAERPALADAVRAMTPNQIAARLRAPDDEGWQALAERWSAFIEEFGFRGQGEVDPSYADWEEEPAYALSTVKAFLDAPEERSPYRLEAAAAAQREAVEADLAGRMPAEHQAEYRRLLEGAQTFARMRESTKANWVRADRLLRKPMLDLGRRLVTTGVIDAPADIFWLVYDEVKGTINGAGGQRFQDRVTERKAEAERLLDIELPEVFELPVQAAPKASVERATQLQGMPVSAGKATGPARVVMSTASALEVEMKPGEVLVAPFTDAPWTPLFVAACAVVTETGGVLSHAATVAREYGIPAVVAVKGATSLIQTGQIVTVDATTGTVTVEG